MVGTGSAVIAACGASTVATAPTTPTPPATKPSVAGVPPGLSPAERREFTAGRTLALAAGCSECHRIDDRGPAGPGPDLSDIGARLPPAAIARELRDPTAPMPSYPSRPAARLRALVAYLSRLRSPPGAGRGQIVGINVGRP